jgi:hypothetical protein
MKERVESKQNEEEHSETWCGKRTENRTTATRKQAGNNKAIGIR